MAELDPRLYTVAWIAPLEIEAQAALHLLDNRHKGRFPLTPRDDYVFQAGDACGHNIIIATLPAGEVYGTRSAAALATQVKKFFPNLWFGLLVGVAAGLPNLSRNPPLDIRLGDVLVGLPVGDNAGLIDYDLGKETGKDGLQLLCAGHALARTETVVRSAIGSIKLRAPNDLNDILKYYKRIENKEHSLGTFADPGQERDTLYQVDKSGIESLVSREQRSKSKRIRVWYGSIGSGDKLMKNARKRNELRDKHNIIGLEMEAAGTMDQIPVGVIRGVCDYGDERKNDEWQPYAAAMAAAYARAVLEEIRPKNAVQEPSSDVSFKREVDEGYSASGNEHMKRQCYIEGKEYPVIETTDATVWQSLIEQLYFDKIDERLMNLTAAQGKTCCWFLTKPEYIFWNDPSQQPNHGGFLWIKGHPGTGKSTLMKFLFEKAKISAKANSSQITLSFFFLARGAIEEKSTTGLYRSLLHQLFKKASETQKSLEWMTADGTKIIQRNGWHETALKQTLAHSVQILGNRSLMIFVDALDECNKDEVADMVSFFEELCDSAQEWQVQLQVCFSSRHYPTIGIKKGLEVILEDEAGHTKDIEYYINSKLRLGNSIQAITLRSEILKKSSNIFLWVVLVLDILNREYYNSSVSIKKMRVRLREIPPELNDLFEMILTTDGESLDQLQLCLKWILFASRPLKPQELYFAVQLGCDKECSGNWDKEDIEFEGMKTFVRNCSKGLAEITRNKALEVQFIHESVRGCLLNKYETQWSEASGNFTGNSHKLLRDCCLAQLNSLVLQDLGIKDPLPHASKVGQLRKTIISNYPFLEYSVLNTLHHANEAQQNYIDQRQFLADFPLKKWILLNNTLEQYQIRRYTNSVSLLYILAEGNLINLIRIHPKRFCFFDVELEVERYGTPILAALATNSHEAVCAFLKITSETVHLINGLCELYHHNKTSSRTFGRDFAFSRKKDVLTYLEEEGEEIFILAFLSSRLETNFTDTSNRSPLPRDGHNAVFGVDLNGKDNKGRTPLSWAAGKGHIFVIQLLLAQYGNDLNCKDNGGRTPLSWAAGKGNISIIQLLLPQDGLDLNCKDNDGLTPLSWAAGRGHISVVQLFFAQRGVDLNCKDNNGRTPLLWAAQNKQNIIVEWLLMQDGVKRDCKDKYGQTLLLLASQNGHDAAVRLLLAQDINLDFRNKYGQTPLTLAARNGHNAIVKLLLTQKVDPDCKDNTGRTPLSLAAEYGHDTIVKLLLAQRVDTDCKDNAGQTPLSWAAEYGHDAIVQLLFTQRVDSDCEDNAGQMPLTLAVRDGHDIGVELLLAQRVDSYCKDDTTGFRCHWLLSMGMMLLSSYYLYNVLTQITKIIRPDAAVIGC